MQKLGKHLPKRSLKTLQLSRYLPRLAAAPQYHYGLNMSSGWAMLGNDTIGDCTCAGAGHAEMAWTKSAGGLFTPDTQSIISAYSAVSGYDPATGRNDNGAACLDVLNYWRNEGIAGQKIGAFAQVNISNIAEMKAAIYLFGLVYVGIAMPLAFQNQPKEWRQGPGLGGDYAPGSWGGHCVIFPGYDELTLDVITWGERINMTWEAWLNYGDEAYAIVSTQFLSKTTNESPLGFDTDQLNADLAQFGQHD